MPAPLKKQQYIYDEASYGTVRVYPGCKVQQKIRKKKKNVFLVFIRFIIASAFLSLFVYFAAPHLFTKYFEPLVLNHILNRNLKLNIEPYVSPHLNYLHNSHLFGQNLIVPNQKSTKTIVPIITSGEFTSLKSQLLNLFAKYPKMHPAVYVWEYSTGKGLEIRADEPYESASIIKIPIAFELMRLIDESQKTQNPIKLTDKRKYTNQYKTLGSGHLQYTKTDVDYTLDYLANEMIAVSDNSATNMILYEIGGMDSFNRAMRNIGLKTTSMGQWLPDLEGYNKITAREISEILYNINNPYYIPPKYKNVLKEYLGNTKNIHLLKEKLPPDTMVLHKTGNIATMLGDSGIIYTSTGKKYIVTILVKRPRNNYNARFLIQDASLIIYNDINKLN